MVPKLTKKRLKSLTDAGKPDRPHAHPRYSDDGQAGEAAKAAHAHHEKVWPAPTDGTFKLPAGYRD